MVHFRGTGLKNLNNLKKVTPIITTGQKIVQNQRIGRKPDGLADKLQHRSGGILHRSLLHDFRRETMFITRIGVLPELGPQS